MSSAVEYAREEAWRWLRELRPAGIQLGLDRALTVLERLGSPHENLPAVTIAGTNGKGSTAVFTAQIAHSAGYRVGLYTSPHLLHVTERIRIGNLPIDRDDLARLAFDVRCAADGQGGQPAVPLTYFEALTIVALLYFREREVDLAILEVGLGGRFDATAVVDPTVAVLTSIGLDHQEFLGTDLESICREKAGIIRRGSTVVTGVRSRLFKSVVGPRAFDLRCPIRRAGVDFMWQWLDTGFRYRGWIHRVGPTRLGLQGIHQGHNAALACATIESLAARGFAFKPVHVFEGLQRARHPGRLDRREACIDRHGRRWPAVLLDGAHNPQAVELLARQLNVFLPERPRAVVFAAKADKNYERMLAMLGRHADVVVLTQLSDVMGHGLDEMRYTAQQHCPHVLADPSVERALEVARRTVGPTGGMVVTGSLYLIADTLAELDC